MIAFTSFCHILSCCWCAPIQSGASISEGKLQIVLLPILISSAKEPFIFNWGRRGGGGDGIWRSLFWGGRGGGGGEGIWRSIWWPPPLFIGNFFFGRSPLLSQINWEDHPPPHPNSDIKRKKKCKITTWVCYFFSLWKVRSGMLFYAFLHFSGI